MRWAIEIQKTQLDRRNLEDLLARLGYVPAFFSPRATRVLDLLSIESPTGEVLFKIYELMRGGRESRTAFGKQFGISDEDYKRFSDTVHKDSVSGDWARHAHGEPASTDQPMTKEEAEAFVRRIAKAWLQHIRTVCVS